ncbi:YopX family protein [Bacillus velezensis]|uniref:YopX family protein n=1 Tax=Bacillus velezensis TaxID=492670 RepID=UPI001F0DE5AD|nr:YopX family protein [Bacillus velezensis]UMQ51378.1 YopX family protein [Bacillus velezensis]
MNAAYRVWDGEQMHHWDDEGLSLEIKMDEWILWREQGMGCRVSIAESGDGESVLMWGTGQKDEGGKMIYPGDEIEYEERNLSQAFGGGNGPDFIRQKRIISIAKGRHNVPSGFIKKLKVIGNSYETPKLSEGAE